MDSPTLVCGTQYDTNMKNNTNNKLKKKEQKTKAPVAVTAVARTTRPVFGMKSGTIRVSHKEFVGTLSSLGSSAFVMMGASSLTPGYDINPGCNALFPWLSGIARLYEKFRFSKLSFSLVSSNPTSTAGKVYMAVDYDYDDDVASSKVNLLTNHTVVQTSVWNDCSLEVDARLMNQNMDWRYTVASAHRSGAIEPRTTFGGFLMAATDGASATCTFDLWVSYDVEFSIERLDENFVSSCSSDTVAPLATSVVGTYTVPFSSPPINVPSTMRIVNRGDINFPATSSSWAGAQWMLDLTTAGLNFINIVTRLRNGAGSQATTIIEDPQSKWLQVLSSGGTNVTQVTLDTVGNGTVGRDSADPTIANTYARLVGTINVPELLRNYPTAKWITPCMAITTAGYAVDFIQSQLFASF